MILISPLFGEVSMSLVNVKSGRYIKVLRDQAIFTPQSVSVAYYSFVSKEAKEEFFARKRGVENFVLAVEDYLEVENERLTRDIEDYAKEKNLESVGSIDELPKKFSKERIRCIFHLIITSQRNYIIELTGFSDSVQ